MKNIIKSLGWFFVVLIICLCYLFLLFLLVVGMVLGLYFMDFKDVIFIVMGLLFVFVFFKGWRKFDLEIKNEIKKEIKMYDCCSMERFKL